MVEYLLVTVDWDETRFLQATTFPAGLVLIGTAKNNAIRISKTSSVGLIIWPLVPPHFPVSSGAM